MADPVDPRAGLDGDWVVVGSPSGNTQNQNQSGPPPPYASEGTATMGRRSAALNNMSEADYLKYRESIWNTQLRPALSQIADPKTISDVAALLIPDAQGVRTGAAATIRAGATGTRLLGRGTELLGKGMEAVGANRQVQGVSKWIGGGTAASGQKLVGGAIAGTPVALEYGGKGLQAVGRGLQTAGRAVGEELGALSPGAAQAAPAAAAAPLSAADLIKAGPPPGAAQALEYLSKLVPGERQAVQQAWAKTVAEAGGPEKYFGTKAPSWRANRAAPTTAPSGSTVPPPAAPAAEAAAAAPTAAPTAAPAAAPPPAAPTAPPAAPNPWDAIEKAKAASPRTVWPEPAAPPARPAPASSIVPPKALGSTFTAEQMAAVEKMPPVQREIYLKLRQQGATHAEALRGPVSSSEAALAERAADLKARMGTDKAAAELFGKNTPETRARIRELAPGPSRKPLDTQTGWMDERFKDVLADPKIAELLQSLRDGGLGAIASHK